MLTRSPLAPEAFPELPPIDGVQLASLAAGIKYSGREDLLVAELAVGTTAAGVFTKSLCPSAPVDWCREVLPNGSARVLVVNSGNANAFTGSAGVASVERTAAAAARVFGCGVNQIYLASTGVIGEPLPDEKITAALPKAQEALVNDIWPGAAGAIMTTDTFPKGASATAKIGGVDVTINGIAKGSGMIAPDMATMLGFIFTDAAIPAKQLQALLGDATDRSFNCVTVDSDTSTSDTVLLFATGKAGNTVDSDLEDFKRALDDVCMDLAQQLAKDGEGAQKFVTISISGAQDQTAARVIALAVANSPLVKTAVAGEDANWGRVVMAIGKAGQKAERDKISISIGGVEVAKSGQVVPGYDEAPVAEHMKGQNIVIEADVGVGSGEATVWTCDLTHGYIDINADYRT